MGLKYTKFYSINKQAMNLVTSLQQKSLAEFNNNNNNNNKNNNNKNNNNNNI